MTFEDHWFLIYSQIVGIQHHPKNEERMRMTPEQCANAADLYMEEFKKRAPIL